MSAAQVNAWDNCLGCMACVTACPSGVQYDKLIEDTRGQVERRWARPRGERLRRRAIFALFPHPERMKWIAPVRAAGAADARASSGAARACSALTQLAPPRRQARGAARAHAGAGHQARARRLPAGLRAARLLRQRQRARPSACWPPRASRSGRRPSPRCCGALQLHTGESTPASERARDDRGLRGLRHVVVNAAGCGSAMKDYGHLLRDDPEWSERAAAFSAKVRDVHELLAEHEPQRRRATRSTSSSPTTTPATSPTPRASAPSRARCCATIPGLELREPAEWELCCGSAGVCNLLNPEPARRARRAQGPQPARHRRAGRRRRQPRLRAADRPSHAGLPVHHPMELLAASIHGRKP